jgi:hypothetical protein
MVVAIVSSASTRGSDCLLDAYHAKENLSNLLVNRSFGNLRLDADQQLEIGIEQRFGILEQTVEVVVAQYGAKLFAQRSKVQLNCKYQSKHLLSMSRLHIAVWLAMCCAYTNQNTHVTNVLRLGD